MRKILIDTDPGQDIDDLLAIHFSLLRDELDIRAITTVTWPAEQRARLVRALLHFAGRSDIPVAAGMAYPFRPMGENERARQHDLSHCMNHACFADDFEDASADLPGAGAADLIIRTVEENPGEVTLCCIGPLTNIAVALCRRPEIAAKIPAIYLMGGELALNQREHNIAFDAVAADVVLCSGIPIAMGTWSVTRRFTLPMTIVDRFTSGGSPLSNAFARAVAAWHPAQSWKPGPVMYDIFPMIHAMGRPLYTLQQQSVQVVTTPGPTFGFTVSGGSEKHIEYTIDIDADAVRDLYLQTVFS